MTKTENLRVFVANTPIETRKPLIFQGRNENGVDKQLVLTRKSDSISITICAVACPSTVAGSARIISRGRLTRPIIISSGYRMKPQMSHLLPDIVEGYGLNK